MKELKPLVDNDKDYTLDEAIAEANRCLNCPKPLCRTGCPIEQEIPQFIHALAQGNLGEANDIIYHCSDLPALCGRLCPRENQCEGHCILNRAKKPINIGKLERFVADFRYDHPVKTIKRPKPEALAKVAVVGAGPAGLSAAMDLARDNYEVTVFEQADAAGGVLLYGIPEFRLTKSLVEREIKKLEGLGVTFVYNTVIGKDKTIDQLFEDGYQAVFVGTGTHVPMDMSMDNDQVSGVIQAMSILIKVQLHLEGKIKEDSIPVAAGDRVVVIGAGNVAIDAARMCVALGADVTIAYRRGEVNMACLPSEYEEAKEDGVKFVFYASPKAVEGKDKVEGFTYDVQEAVGDPKEGKIQSTGQVKTIPCDKIVIAIGHKPNPALFGQTAGIETDEKGYIKVSEGPYGMTSRPGVFAAGDTVHRPATVVLAMREGRKTAKGIEDYCQKKA
ncbi:MAG: NAD(P)-dependent oxidoreductase [Veillonellaceae bacterium]|nr:NAD(P)-dependent oxidoreductase [Veillonellaceae bacterium]